MPTYSSPFSLDVVDVKRSSPFFLRSPLVRHRSGLHLLTFSLYGMVILRALLPLRSPPNSASSSSFSPQVGPIPRGAMKVVVTEEIEERGTNFGLLFLLLYYLVFAAAKEGEEEVRAPPPS